jgi:penicillin-binding protein 2
MSATRPVKPPPSRMPISPQLSLRVAVLAGVALVMFGVIFFRLWYLQVLTGEQYVQQADANVTRSLPIQAPRGEILDREGKPIVRDQVTNAVQIIPSELPPAGHERLELYRRLGVVLHMSARKIQELVIAGRNAVRYAPVTIKTDAGRGVLTVLGERQNQFPGVIQAPVSIRSYPYGEMAAQTIGYVGQVKKAELSKSAFRGVKEGTVVGQEGLEYYYDRYLRGTPGVQRVEVNTAGEPVPANIAPTEPKAGYALRLTLDLSLQQEGERALRKGMELAKADGNPGDAGAFVAMNPLDGEIYAIGSAPSFDPSRFAKPLTKAELDQLEGVGTETPARLFNRAVNSAYPTGSTFKPITAMGALEAGFLNPNEGHGAGQCIYVSTEKFCNAGEAEYGAVGLVDALKVSSDTYFFEVGEIANGQGNGEAIQHEAHKLGIGEETHIDLPSESMGLVPDRRWRAEVAAAQRHCERDHPKRPCEISDGRPWSVGDDMHLAVGQGDLQTTPLQMAVAYSTLANAYMHGGEGVVVRPHLGMDVDTAGGELVQALNFPPRRHVHLDYQDLSLVMQGIHEATSEPGGTSADVWSGWNQAAHPVYGKTGTAERLGQVEQAWYMCFLPDPKRPIVIAVTVEQGGFGDQAAAPVARLMASEWFKEPLKLVNGSNPDH